MDSTELQKNPRALLAEFPPVQVVERESQLEDDGYFPCTDCHDGVDQIANPKIRDLEEEHEDINLVHGKGRFWCLRCHHAEDRDQLTNSNKIPISFNDQFLLCGECHFRQQKDFFLGAHGKRLNSWQGEKVLTPCTACHNPHDPSIKKRKPKAPPKPRKNLKLKQKTHSQKKSHPWTASDASSEQTHQLNQ